MAIDIGCVGSSSSDKSADFEEFAGDACPSDLKVGVPLG